MHETVRETGAALAHTVLTGEGVDLAQSALNIAGSAAQSAGANAIGLAKVSGAINSTEQTLLHAPAVGELVRSAQHGVNGATVTRMAYGAAGAMAAETLANVLMDPMKAAMQIATEHPEFDEQQLEAAVLHELRPMRNAIELTTASLALSSGDPRVLGVVAHAAGTSLDHNALGPITTKVAAALAKAAQTRAVQSFKAFITRSAKKSAEQAERKAFLEASKRSTTDPKAMKSYVREVEKVSGTKMGDAQKTKLVDAVRQNKYSKVSPAERDAHNGVFRSTKSKIIAEWEKNTGQTWPKYEKINPITGAKKIENYQAHHIIPQQLRGPHEWWNIHPVHPSVHQSGIHGSGSVLNQILRNLSK